MVDVGRILDALIYRPDLRCRENRVTRDVVNVVLRPSPPGGACR